MLFSAGLCYRVFDAACVVCVASTALPIASRLPSTYTAKTILLIILHFTHND